MGRTTPTYRTFLDGLESDWSAFRRVLRDDHPADFDRLFAHARRYADAAGHQNPPEPRWGFVVAVLLAQERERRRLAERADRLEERVDALTDRVTEPEDDAVQG